VVLGHQVLTLNPTGDLSLAVASMRVEGLGEQISTFSELGFDQSFAYLRWRLHIRAVIGFW